MGYGFLTGVLVGWTQPYLLGVAVPEFGVRVFLALQMGAAFAVIGLFLTNYLSVRRKVQQRYQRDRSERDAASEISGKVLKKRSFFSKAP